MKPLGMNPLAQGLGKSARGRAAAPARLAVTAAFGANPGNLRMLSYAPGGLAPGAPLVVVLHGCTQDAEGYAAGAGWIDLADRYGFALVVPDQQAANNPNRCFNWFQPDDAGRGRGEAASIRAMIEAAVVAHRCDRSRVFVTGLSAGGAMASAMLAAYPEVFAGGGVIAGLPYGAAGSMQEAFGAMMQGRRRTPEAWGAAVRAASAHKGPWPRVSIWQGDADATVNPANADSIAQQWAEVHGLAAGPTRTELHGARRRDVWLSAAGEPRVEVNTLAGLGHGTPISARGPEGWGAPGPFVVEAGVSSSLELLRFWGLAPAAAQGPAAATPPPRAEPPKPRSADRHGIDVQAVISKALAAAGLLK